ncbi:hypothetical protein GWI33_012376 [Rhynchophorus ferrugineus]|uniref:Uncharacterized protein n=1 Tax=Rhynchophorus ferrugineus TaxID=354439 RepID=A0A834M7P1_RHYFE|nr:hypothetical protein GWI33_012376 [Rhynchophorus ferrugineus]
MRKIFENLSLTSTPKPHPTISEPPTPPSTPLSPKNAPETSRGASFNLPALSSQLPPMASKLPHGHAPQSSLGHAPATMIGQSSKTGQNFPLNLNMKREERDIGGVINGSADSYSEEVLRSKGDEESRRAGIFSGNIPFSHLNKTDNSSPPPLDSPLNVSQSTSIFDDKRSFDDGQARKWARIMRKKTNLAFGTRDRKQRTTDFGERSADEKSRDVLSNEISRFPNNNGGPRP